MYLFPNKRSRKSKRGLILVVSLWLITAIAIFGIALARITYAQSSFVKFRVNSFLSSNTMDGLVLMLKYDRMRDQTPGYDTLLEFPTEEKYESGRCEITYSLIDEGSKININKAPSSILENLPEMDKDTAIAIVSSTLRPFSAKEEILLLDEIEEEDYNNIKDYITIHGEGRVNINICSEEILEIIGAEKNLIKAIVNYRKNGEAGFFESTGEILSVLKDEGYLSLRDEQELISLLSKNLLSVKSNDFNITADVYVSSKVVSRYSIIFGKDKNGYRTREWRQR